MDAESRGGGGGGRPLRTASLPSIVRSFELGEELPLGERDRRLAASPPACQAGRLTGGGGRARLARRRRRRRRRRQADLAAGSPARGSDGRTDGGRCTIYGCGLGEGERARRDREGKLIPVMRTQDECLPTYLPIGLPCRRREVIFAREGEVVKDFGFIARRGTVYVPMRSD